MKIAVMQPYFFPYIGYFQLVASVDKFVFYDDVNFIKNGWINRNRILINGNPSYLTVQLKDASPFKLIKDIIFTDNRPKLKKSIQMAYKKAPYYEDVWPIIDKCLNVETNKISELAIESIITVSQYLNLTTSFERSSDVYSDTKASTKEARLKRICHSNSAGTYINPIGGMELYDKEDFLKSNINLLFLSVNDLTYQQFSSCFTPNLSIIDVLMFNSSTEVKRMLKECSLI